MTPAEKIKSTIIRSIVFEGRSVSDPEDTDEYHDALQDFREGEFTTNIQPPYSRHYESQSVAAKMFDGSYCGWVYWYGGGKHGDPGSIPWMQDAYELTCEEKQEMVTVRKWSKVDA